MRSNMDADVANLAQRGRWVERVIPCGDGTHYIVVAAFYGISGASADPPLARLNERLIKMALFRASEFTSTPYFLCGDLNIDPAASMACRAAFESGVLADIPMDWAGNNTNPQATYRKDGVFKGMQGREITRIDTVVGNGTAKAIVKGVEYLWLHGRLFDHVPILLHLDLDRFDRKVLRAATPVSINLTEHHYARKQHHAQEQRRQIEQEAHDTFSAIWQLVAQDFDDAIKRKDVNEGNRIWSYAAELWMYLGEREKNPGDVQAELFSRKAMPRRRTPMPLREESLVKARTDGNDTRLLGCDEAISEICARAKRIRNILHQHALRGEELCNQHVHQFWPDLGKTTIMWSCSNPTSAEAGMRRQPIHEAMRKAGQMRHHKAGAAEETEAATLTPTPESMRDHHSTRCSKFWRHLQMKANCVKILSASNYMMRWAVSLNRPTCWR